jgi:hypothetical protein
MSLVYNNNDDDNVFSNFKKIWLARRSRNVGPPS